MRRMKRKCRKGVNLGPDQPAINQELEVESGSDQALPPI